MTLAPGTAVLLSPDHLENFRFARETESRHSWCAIQVGAVPPALQKQVREARGPAPFTGAMASLHELALGGTREEEGNEYLENRYALHLGLAMFCDFTLAVQAGGARSRAGEDVIARVTKFISRELARPLALSDLARAGGVSNQHLLKLFRDRKMETPTRLLYAKRLEAARDWLAHTGLSIGEISDRCGFANAFHFSRKFRQAHGISPRAWRVKTWG
jgi:AraC-like DNA-binding protein